MDVWSKNFNLIPVSVTGISNTGTPRRGSRDRDNEQKERTAKDPTPVGRSRFRTPCPRDTGRRNNQNKKDHNGGEKGRPAEGQGQSNTKDQDCRPPMLGFARRWTLARRSESTSIDLRPRSGSLPNRHRQRWHERKGRVNRWSGAKHDRFDPETVHQTRVPETRPKCRSPRRTQCTPRLRLQSRPLASRVRFVQRDEPSSPRQGQSTSDED